MIADPTSRLTTVGIAGRLLQPSVAGTRPREVSVLTRALANCTQAVAAGFAQVEAMQEPTAAEPELPSGDVAAVIQEIEKSVADWSLTARPQRAESKGK
jgi:hypothetical protein